MERPSNEERRRVAKVIRDMAERGSMGLAPVNYVFHAVCVSVGPLDDFDEYKALLMRLAELIDPGDSGSDSEERIADKTCDAPVSPGEPECREKIDDVCKDSGKCDSNVPAASERSAMEALCREMGGMIAGRFPMDWLIDHNISFHADHRQASVEAAHDIDFRIEVARREDGERMARYAGVPVPIGGDDRPLLPLDEVFASEDGEGPVQRGNVIGYSFLPEGVAVILRDGSYRCFDPQDVTHDRPVL